jgi:2-oxoglutarate ferredoxin oxidoreductase subunit delta
MTIRQKGAKEKKRMTDIESNNYWQKKQNLDKKGLKFFSQIIFYDWCKACGICIAFCPKKVFDRSEEGKPVIQRPDDCIGCGFCELHCPDFAITIKERYPDRRRREND